MASDDFGGVLVEDVQEIPPPDLSRTFLKPPGLNTEWEDIGFEDRKKMAMEFMSGTQMPEAPRGFGGAFQEGLQAPSKGQAAAAIALTKSDDELKNILLSEFREQEKQSKRYEEQPQTFSEKAGQFIGGLAGSLPQYIAPSVVAGPVGPFVSFGASAGGEEFLKAGTRALGEGKSPEEALAIAKAAAPVGASIGGTQALILPGGTSTWGQAARESGKQAGAAGAGTTLMNLYERALGLKPPVTEGVLENMATMGALPLAGHALGRILPRIQPLTERITDATKARQVEGGVPGERPGIDAQRTAPEAGIGDSLQRAKEVQAQEKGPARDEVLLRQTPSERAMTPEKVEPSPDMAPEELAQHQEVAQRLIDRTRSDGINVAIEESPPPEYSSDVMWTSPDGVVHVNTPRLQQWIKEIGGNNLEEWMQSGLTHESIHSNSLKFLENPAEAMRDYYSNATKAEKLLAERAYYRKFGNKEIDPFQMGSEMFRRDMERLMELKPTEVIQSKGLEWVKQKFIDVLERGIQRTRQALGTKASKAQRSILDKYQQKIDSVRRAKGWEAPAELRMEPAKEEKKALEPNPPVGATIKENLAQHRVEPPEQWREVLDKYGVSYGGKWEGMDLYNADLKDSGAGISWRGNTTPEQLAEKINAKRREFVEAEKKKASSPAETALRMEPKKEELKGKFSKELEDEINYLVNVVERELEPGEAKYTRGDAIKEMMQNMDDPSHWSSEFKKELQDYGAKIGIFKPNTKAEIDSIVRMGRGKKYDFKRGDTYYTFEDWKPLQSISETTPETALRMEPKKELQEESKKPEITQATRIGNTIYMSFDITGKVPKPEEIRSMFKESGHDVEVVQFSPNVLSTAGGVVKFRVDVFDKSGRYSTDAAKSAYLDAFGKSENIRGKSKTERSIPPEERFTRSLKKYSEMETGTAPPESTPETKALRMEPKKSALEEEPSMGKVSASLNRYRMALRTVFKASPNRKIMDQRFDGADTAANNAGQQARNSIEIGSTPIEREAAMAIIEANGDREKLDQFLAQSKKNPKAAAAVRYANANWDRLQPLAERTQKILDSQIKDENNNGISTEFREAYVPHIYDTDLLMGKGMPYVISGKGSGGSTGFKKGRTFDTVFDAIEAGYTPKSIDVGKLVEHRVKVGQRLINRKQWSEGLREIKDPTDNRPLVTDIETHQRPNGTAYQSAPMGYERREIIPGVSIAVHSGYSSLFDALTGTSRISGSAPGRAALATAGGIKHGLLLFDTFHASRIMQKQLFLTGKIGYGKGHSLLEYSDADLGRAVQSNLITPDVATWIKEHRSDANLLVKEGLNVGRIQEALYADMIKSLQEKAAKAAEKIGVPESIANKLQFSKWVFEKVTRGAMMESALIELERISKAQPDVPRAEIARKVARDLNTYFGNLGRQGFFKSRTMQDLMNLSFLAPQWMESMARSEVKGALQMAKGVTIDPVLNRTILLGSLGKGMAGGLLAYLVGTQLLNMATRGHPTWDNPEEKHRLDAWIPDLEGGSKGFFMSPMSVPAELTHDMIRYYNSNPRFLSAVGRIMQNKISPLARASQILFIGKDWDKNMVTDDWDRVKRASIALTPTPLPLSPLVREQSPSGSLQRQLTASAGFKTEPAESGRRTLRPSRPPQNLKRLPSR